MSRVSPCKEVIVNTVVATSPRIRQLPPSVITKIAAGEVIERPASVVKELLENSVDAGSRRIDIDIEQGGAELIRVVDDGGGIRADDLPLAFASHATSKLASADDLFSIQTLGFRGEALASIGGVAQVTLQSRPRDEATGAEIICRGGELTEPRAWNGAPGTRIEVRNLFFNTPVRRKFLRTPGTEMGHISEMVTRLALAQPGLHLGLRHNGKDVCEVPAPLGLLERIGLFFGADVRDRLYAFDVDQGPARLFGYLGDPACDRGNARLQYLFLNGRWIRDRGLLHALQEAYRGLIMTGRYATAFLFLELPPDQVDVNVHPTKSEVRFRDSHALWSFVFGSVRNRLSAENLTARLRVSSTLAAPATLDGVAGQFLQPRPVESSPPLFAQTGFPPVTFVQKTNGTNPDSVGWAPPTASATVGSAHATELHVLPQPNGASPASTTAAADSASPPAHVTPPPLNPAPVFKAIQLYNTYLVLETHEGMLVIDQHALHERILFEQLKARLRTGTLDVQKLLIPEPVELTSEQAARALEQRDALAELGLGIDDFGGGTLLVTSYPALLGKRPPALILKNVVDHLTAKDRLPTREVLCNDLLSLMACHAAVRAGDPLTSEEIAALIAQRGLADDAHHCPHGRPTALLFSRHDLERQFRRI
jgi:DNA mismatch repair protein MutL